MFIEYLLLPYTVLSAGKREQDRQKSLLPFFFLSMKQKARSVEDEGQCECVGAELGRSKSEWTIEMRCDFCVALESHLK